MGFTPAWQKEVLRSVDQLRAGGITCIDLSSHFQRMADMNCHISHLRFRRCDTALALWQGCIATVIRLVSRAFEPWSLIRNATSLGMIKERSSSEMLAAMDVSDGEAAIYLKQAQDIVSSERIIEPTPADRIAEIEIQEAAEQAQLAASRKPWKIATPVPWGVVGGQTLSTATGRHRLRT